MTKYLKISVHIFFGLIFLFSHILRGQNQKDSLQNYYLVNGIEYYNDKNFKKSIETLNSSLKINKENLYACESYYYIGVSNILLNNYKTAISYLQTAKILLLTKNRNNKLLLKTCTALSFIYLNYEKRNFENLEIGIKNGEIADSLSSITETSLHRKYLIKFNLASFFNQYETLDIRKAKKGYLEALKIAKKARDTFKITETLIVLGNLFNTTDHDQSLKYLNKAKKFSKKIDSINLRFLHYCYALTFAGQEHYEKSIENIHKSFTYVFKDDLLNVNKSKIILINSEYQRTAIEMIPTLSEVYLNLYEKTGEKETLDKSIEYFKLADFTLDLLRKEAKEFKTRMYWREWSAKIYSKAIRACYLVNNLEDAFYFMEKNKALLLMEDLDKQHLEQKIEVSDSLFNQERDLKYKLVEIRKDIEQKGRKTYDILLQKALIDTQRELNMLQDSIYKKVYSLNLDAEIKDLASVQKNLQNDEVFLEYHISVKDPYAFYSNQENGYLMAITKDKKELIEINNLLDVEEEVRNLIAMTKKPLQTKAQQQEFKSLSNTVYNKLIPDNELQNSLKDKKVSIVPDGYLSFLPFEVLTTNTTRELEGQEPNYLLYSSDIRYLYSYSFLKNNKNEVIKRTNMLGVAPVNFTYDSLTDLPKSEEEVTHIKEYYPTTTFTNELATKENFTKELSNYKIIHLATHANAQDSISPWIAFSDSKINLDELQLYRNKASLVVLSGCNTTVGKEEIGEGVISLARGFFYGGSQSIVSSLWSVDDKATNYIMNAFYKNLSEGKTKSKSLQLAKKEYIKNHSLSEVSPHYWASFILLGENDTLPSPTNYALYILLGIVAVFIVFRYYRIIKKKRLHSSDDSKSSDE